MWSLGYVDHGYICASLFPFFSKIHYFHFMSVCVLLVACTYHVLCSCLVPRKGEEGVGSPEELQQTVLATVWVLRTEPKLSARAASALSLQALSPAPLMHSLNIFFLKETPEHSHTQLYVCKLLQVTVPTFS